MLKKSISYTDYEGEKRTEEFYFNLTKAELMEMNYAYEGGMQVYVNKIVGDRDAKKIYDMFKTLILTAYGEKSVDGRRFVKSKELSEIFSQTEAFSELIMELVSEPDKATAFITGIVPKDLSEAVAAEQAKLKA